MDIRITPAPLAGTLDAISSKSFAHRLLISAALADKPTVVRVNQLSEDIRATARCLRAMGCAVETGGINERLALTVKPLIHKAPASGAVRWASSSVTLDCGESGSTARFLLPLAAFLFGRFTMTGAGRLPGRPFAPLCEALAKAGCIFDGDTLPINGQGSIRPGEFAIAGNISSQFISGLLFTLPLLAGDSRIRLTTPLESAAYVDMTAEVLRRFGITINKNETGFSVKGNQRYQSPGEAAAEGDWSNAAFFLCAGALGGPVIMRGLSMDSAQGDKEIIPILRRFGAKAEGGAVSAGELRGIDIDAAQIPDLVPALAVVAAVSQGETRIYNAGRLRIKESDRIQSTCDLLNRLGADAQTTGDGLTIQGKEKLNGGVVQSAGDHRIVMAAAAAACVCRGPVVVQGGEAVNKSYPSFFEDYKKAGGIAEWLP